MLVKSQVKYIQSLGQKKFRDEEGVFIVEGPKMVKELLSEPALRPEQIFAVKEWLAAVPAALLGAAAVTEIKESELERISGLSTPNQVLAVFRRPVHPAPAFGRGITLVLDGIQDPGNLGTIVRIADWFGVERILATKDSADVYSTKAIQSTMGSVARVPVIYDDPLPVIRQQKGLPVYGAVLKGKSIYDMERGGDAFIVIGNESRGIREALSEAITEGITIPRIGSAESLNAAVAAGIILSHLAGG